MKVEINKSKARGTLYAPTSKSMAHRLLICSALAKGVSVISGVTPCEDVKATADALSALGAEISVDNDTYTVRGIDIKNSKPSKTLFCKESGSTLRFLIPLASLCGENVSLEGAPSLMRRPLDVYKDIFAEKKLLFALNDNTVSLNGALPYGEYTVRGDISSQFITGLLFALPLLDGDSVIHIIPPFESRSYIELTLSALSDFGIDIDFSDPLNIKINGGQSYKAHSCRVEGDFSGSAFTEAFNLLGGDVNVLGLSENSLQGDRVYRELYALLKKGAPEIDIGNCPDLGPILFTLAAALNGASFTGTRRLKIKESDRAAAMAAELRKFGADIVVSENCVIIKKTELNPPSEILLGHNDHRVVMSLSVLLTLFGGTIDGAEAVSKSYPDFFRDIDMLGIDVKIYD